jgi:hypothetical protein
MLLHITDTTTVVISSTFTQFVHLHRGKWGKVKKMVESGQSRARAEIRFCVGL